MDESKILDHDIRTDMSIMIWIQTAFKDFQ